VSQRPPGSLPPVDRPLVFVDDLDAPVLSPDDHHHLRRVLRVRTGAPVTVADGVGRWRRARFHESPEPDSPVYSVEPAQPRLTIAFALVKGARPELVVQKLTELGVDVIVPFVAERSVVRWEPGRDDRHRERLQRVAREAAMQSRRVMRPHVAELATFDDVIGLPGAAAAERHGVAPSLEHPTMLIGPEGGWSDAERRRLVHSVGLGDLVLRAETAAIAGATLLSALRSGLVAPIRAVPAPKPR
jgi:16S rRNA (uracil1498-N3)-methyltransferase